MAKKATKRASRRKPVKRTQSARPRRKPAVKPLAVPQTEAELVQLLKDGAVHVGSFGTATHRLTEEQERILSEPLREEEIRVKPDGALYLPHTSYTNRLNLAFGRLGWALVPASVPLEAQGVVTQHYTLYLKGRPVAMAIGHQRLSAKNENQTFSDAAEASYGKALRRVCKHIGMWLDLWDQDFCRDFQDRRCVRVTVSAGGSEKHVWRLASAPPFYNEVRGGQRRQVAYEERPPQATRPAAREREREHQRTELGQAKINEIQRDQFWSIVRGHGRDEAAVRMFLKQRYGLTSTKDILVKDYVAIMRAIESGRLS